MGTKQTRAVVQRFLDFRAANDFEGIRDTLAPDVVWHLPLSVPFPDTITGNEEIARAMTGGGASAMGLDYLTFQRTIEEFIVEGSRAAVLQPLRAKTFEGADYENLYVWMYWVEGDRIVKMLEVTDTLGQARLCGWS